ncbi:MAG: hypothetical protein ACK5PW_09600 [Burkholderiales bacterium]
MAEPLTCACRSRRTLSAISRSAIVFDDLHFERRPYDKWRAYGQSKTENALHPGGSMTGLQQHLSIDERRAPGPTAAGRHVGRVCAAAQ